LLNVREVAALWRVSETTVERERKDGRLAATRVGNAYRYRRADALAVGAARHIPVVAHQRETFEGDRDARVFAAFNDGCNIAEAVVREHVAVGTVARLHVAWTDAQASKTAVCLHRNHGNCSGAPQMSTALCGHHAARTRILTPEQTLLLSGQEIPTAVQCDVCHKTAARGTCASCLAVIHTTVEGEGLGRRLVMRIRDKVIAIIPNERARVLARELLVDDPFINEQSALRLQTKTAEQKLEETERAFEQALGTPATVRQTDRPLPEGEELQTLLRSLGISGGST